VNSDRAPARRDMQSMGHVLPASTARGYCDYERNFRNAAPKTHEPAYCVVGICVSGTLFSRGG
jgi:hypothetical protein